MSSPLRSLDLVPETATDVATIRTEVNRILTRLQTGGLQLAGLRLDTQRTTVPTVAPSVGESNVRCVTNAGTVEGYVFDGTNWVQFF